MAHEVLQMGINDADCLLGTLDWRRVLHGGSIGHLQKKPTSYLMVVAL